MGVLEHIVSLIRRYQRGKVSDKMRQALDDWSPNIDDLENYPANEENADVERRKIRRQLMEYVRQDMSRKRNRPALLMYRRIAAAAAIVLLVGSGAWFAFHEAAPADSNEQTLLAEAPHRTWTTDDGHRMTLTLPDGSTVKVNAGSRLEIAEEVFNKEKREVWLSGEAFFEVAKNPEKPFIIHTGAMQTTVRGTSFNVKAYDELGENVVSVRDGRVEIAEDGQMLGVLTANRQLKYSTGNRQTEISDADWQDAAGWTEGRLVLNGANAEELKLRLRQHFGVEVNIDSDALIGKRIHGGFGKNNSLEEVLDAISSLYGVHYRINNDHVTINP